MFDEQLAEDIVKDLKTATEEVVILNYKNQDGETKTLTYDPEEEIFTSSTIVGDDEFTREEEDFSPETIADDISTSTGIPMDVEQVEKLIIENALKQKREEEVYDDE